MKAFTRKEWLEQIRSSRLLILFILFVAFGIMNPAIAKMTPWLMETMADSLAEAGMTITEVEVDAMESWTQFFKNIPMALIAFVLMQSSIFTKEYQMGTLIPVLTKGLERYKVIFSKLFVLVVCWTVGYWVCFGITYGYNAYFWDNSIAENLFFATSIWWLFGAWIISLMVFFSVVSRSNTGVILGVGTVCIVAYVIGLFPKFKEYSPSMLMQSAPLLAGVDEPDKYLVSIVITAIISVIAIVLSIPVFNKRKI